MEEFAARLKAVMREKNMKQSALSRITGIDKTLICNYLKGTYKAKQENLYLIAKALNVNEAWLLGYDIDPNPDVVVEEISDTQFISIAKDWVQSNNMTPEEKQKFLRDLARLVDEEKEVK